MPDKKSFAPEGASIVSPYLVVESVEKQIEFFKKVFNAEERDSVKQNDGTINHAEIKIGDTTIMLGRANEKFPAGQGMNYVYVENADETYRRAVEFGATSLMEPEDRFYGNREGGVKDPQGNTWWIAQFLRTVSKEEIEKAMKEFS
jgi:PhnB protein